ncbi:hypothetical protein C8F01DRAFT_1088491 [Mycena amicta]|nr:hypothetical protein C8F01DRAFT_1088491 [Mycena amicta]
MGIFMQLMSPIFVGLTACISAPISTDDNTMGDYLASQGVNLAPRRDRVIKQTDPPFYLPTNNPRSVGLLDDVLIMTNGEKTVPGPMEEMLNASPQNLLANAMVGLETYNTQANGGPLRRSKKKNARLVLSTT